MRVLNTSLEFHSRLSHTDALFDFSNPNWVYKKFKGAREQALFMKILGKDVCAEVYGYTSTEYRMERLLPLTIPAAKTLQIVKQMLQEKVWCRPIPSFSFEPRWRRAIIGWIQGNADWLPSPATLYEYASYNYHLCLIHGDPTLANVMMRANGSIVLIDPLAPQGRIIPSLREVDLGKMLQSAMGWEHQLDPSYPLSDYRDMCRVILENKDGLTQRRAWYWCAVACARVAAHKRSPALEAWGKEASLKALEEMNQCSC